MCKYGKGQLVKGLYIHMLAVIKRASVPCTQEVCSLETRPFVSVNERPGLEVRKSES